MVMARKRRANLKLSECWLYAVDSPVDLARRLSTPKHLIEAAELATLARDAGNFRLFSIKGASGKLRPIQEPKRRLQWIHARIHALLSRVEAPEYLHSAVRGRSYISNAAAHDPSMPAIKIDVKKFFPSVTRAAIFNFFDGPMKCRRDVAGLLADILTFEARLPTGSAASPIIAFYAFQPMFDEIEQLAVTYGLTMTCYVDDMTLSGARANKGVLFEMHKIIARHGLKSHKAHVFAATQPKVVTGVCNTPAGPRAPNKLHLKIKLGFESLSAATTPNAKKEVLRPLLGRLEAAGQIDPTFRARAITVRATHSK
jgi:RNA-directed DNA polymerase